MSVIDHFFHSWRLLQPADGAEPMSLPTRTAAAVADALPGVRGSVICVQDGAGVRVTVGHSDAQALLAEQLEYTVGDGPGLQAQRTGSALVAGDHFARHWPVFHEALLSHTPFHAVRVIPLVDAPTAWPATLLLFYGSVDEAHNANISDIIDVVAIVAGVVVFAAPEIAAQLRPASGVVAADFIAQRLRVRSAIDVVAAALSLPSADALAVLRGISYRRGETIDVTAMLLTTGQLDAGAA